MKKIAARLALFALCSLVCASALAAQDQTVNGVVWSYTFDGSALPTASSPAWTVASGGSGTGSASSNGALLDVRSFVGSANALSYQQSNVATWDARTDTTVEARLQVLSWDSGGVSGTSAQTLKIDNGSRDFQLNFRTTEVFFLGGPSFAIDATKFHTYRVTISGTTATLYVDGGPTPVLTRAETVATTANVLRFGDVTASGGAEVLWDHVRWTNRGAFAPVTRDVFGTLQMYASADGGREYQSHWDNGTPRTLSSGSRDPYDAELIVRGTGHVDIDGAGVARMVGSTPRIYIYDAAKAKTWTNAEVTFYALRGGETPTPVGYAGFVAGTRSDHQDQSTTNPNPCAHTYYGRILYDGRIDFEKEHVHAYYASRPLQSSGPTVSYNVWIGYKFVVRTVGAAVNLKLYEDITDGENGGTWALVGDYTDVGTWDTGTACTGGTSSEAMLAPGASTFIRNDEVTDARYKKFTVREINPGN